MDCPDIQVLQGDQAPWGVGRGRAIRAAALELTQQCDNRCRHCYLDHENRSIPADLPTSFWLDLLDALVIEETLFLSLTGGEPLLRRDFAQIYEAAKRRGFLPVIMTNGRRITDGIAHLLHELPPRMVSISLYGATEATYDAIARAPGAFSEAMAGIGRLHDLGIPFSLKTMLLRGNVHELEQMQAFADDLGVEFRSDPAVTPTVDGATHVLAERLPAETVVEIELRDQERREAYAEQVLEAEDLAPTRRLFTCGAGAWNIYVDATGMVLPCASARRYAWPLDKGDMQPDLHRIFSEEFPRVLYREVSGEHECGACNLRGLCPTCPASRDLESGSPTIPCEFGCEVARLRAEGAREHPAG